MKLSRSKKKKIFVGLAIAGLLYYFHINHKNKNKKKQNDIIYSGPPTVPNEIIPPNTGPALLHNVTTSQDLGGFSPLYQDSRQYWHYRGTNTGTSTFYPTPSPFYSRFPGFPDPQQRPINFTYTNQEGTIGHSALVRLVS